MVPSHVERKDARETWQKAWLGRKRWVGEGACSMVGIRLESIGGRLGQRWLVSVWNGKVVLNHMEKA